MMQNDNNKNDNFPTIRFKEFTEVWEVKKLGEICQIRTGNKDTQDKVDDGIYPFYVRSNTIERINSYTLDEKAILTSGDGVGVGKIFHLVRGKFAIHQRVYALTQFKHNFLIDYVYYFFSEKFYKRVITLSAKNSVDSVRKNMISDMKMPYPSLLEQTKIANFLSKLDEKIQAQREIIEELRLLFKGVQKKVYNNGTKKVKIEKILTEVNEKTTINNQYEVLSSTVKGIFKQSEYFDRKVASENNIGYKILKEKQVVLSPQNLWMRNINYNDEFEIGIVSPSYKVFNINDEHNKIYIAYLLKSHRAFYEYMNASEQGASVVRRNLNMHLFNEISFVVPQKKEQDKIAKALSSFSEKLKTEQELLSAYEQQKKYFLQNMFC